MREVQALVGCPGVDINYVDSHGWTSLLAAAHNGHLQVVRLLLCIPGIDVNKATSSVAGETPLILASQLGNVEEVMEFLAHPQINVNQARTTDGATPLIIATWHGLLEVVKRLLRCPKVHLGVRVLKSTSSHYRLERPGVNDKYAKTELEYAREGGHQDIVKAIQSRQILLQLGHTC